MTSQAFVASTTPYPWPYDGVLNWSASAVVVVSPRRAVGMDPEVLDRVRTVAAETTGSGGTVVLVTTAPPDRSRTRPTTPGGPTDHLGVGAHVVLHADGIDGFYESGLEHELRGRGIDRLLVVGADLETSVHSTMRSANDRGFECLLVLDACSPHDPALVARAVSMVEMSGGIFGAVGTSGDLLDALRGAAADAQPPTTPATTSA